MLTFLRDRRCTVQSMSILSLCLLVFCLLPACSRDNPDYGQEEEEQILDKEICRVQDPDHANPISGGTSAIFEDVVVTAIAPDGHFFVQDPDGCGPKGSLEFSGAYVYDNDEVAPEDLMVGDIIIMEATNSEYNGLTELEPITVVVTGHQVLDLRPAIVDACDVATGGELAENYEGVLIQVNNATVTDPDLGFGEFELDECLRVDDLLHKHAATLDETIGSIRGVLTYNFDNFKLLPRKCGDIKGVEAVTNTIYQIQNPDHPEFLPDGSVVLFDEVIVTAVRDDGDFWIEEPAGGPWSGVYVYDSVGLAPADLAVGDELTIGGEVSEFYDLTELSYLSIVTRTGSGLPVADVVAPCDISDGGALAEAYEGVLVRVLDVTCTAAPNFYNEFELDDCLMVDDELYFYDAVLGEEFASVTGIQQYAFGSFKLIPRDEDDIDKDGCEDADGDGYKDETCGGDDCDDSDPAVNPGAVEGPEGDPTCSDGIDNDCDDDIDGADAGCSCEDGDGDGYLDEACGGDDCDDGDPAVNPGAAEGPEGDPTCSDTIDNDCDGYVDGADYGCAGGTDDTIYQVQNSDHPEFLPPGTKVTFEGVIVTAVTTEGNFWIEEPNGGAWSGVYVYDRDGHAPANLTRGDQVTVEGETTEFYELTEISYVTNVERTGQGLDEPGPDVVDPCDIGEGGSMAEDYEGVLVRVLDVTVTAAPDSYGEWEVEGCLMVDDALYDYDAVLGEQFASVTGIHQYYYNFKILPRDADDLADEEPCDDIDGDGYEDEECGGDDCDDSDPAVNPGVTEGPTGDPTCSDGIDNDCDDDIDGADAGCSCWDVDGDGYLDEACGGDDCDDGDPAVNPGTVEGPEGDPTCSDVKDNDCDGYVDDADSDCTDTVIDPGDVLIDELLYDPAGTDTGHEYIILYNATGAQIDLTGLEIQWGGKDFTYGLYVIPSATLGAGEELLIGGDQMSPTPDLVYNFNFQNGGNESDGVRIVADDRAVIDTVIYDSPNTNGLAGDGGLDPYPDAMCAPDVAGGKVLTRDALHTDTDDCAADLTEDDPIGECEDADGDGYDDEACGGNDCDDGDPAVNPGATEGPQGDPTCSDLVDNDCDDDIDEADSGCACWDGDGDGYMDEACGGDDCDDGDPGVNPGAVEGPPGDATCSDLADNDCDEYIDEADPDCIVSEDDTIYQLQNTGHPEYIPEDSAVTVEGVIVTGVTASGHFFVEEPAGGAWSGVYVFDPAGIAPADLAVGDELSISGTVDEYFDLTEIKDLTSVERTDQGLDVPDPEVVDSCDIATGGSMGESYEGVLVRVENVEVTNPDLDYGEFEVDGCLNVDDLMYLHVATLGEVFASVTGVHNYSFENYKLEPRSAADLVPAGVTTTTTVPGATTTTTTSTTTTTIPGADDTIYQLQNPAHPAYIPEDSAVMVAGVIVTGVTASGHYFVEEPAGGAWSGVYVFDPAGLAPADLAVGDELSISGTVTEYYDLTEIKDLTSVERTDQGLDVPDPEVVDSCDIATGGSMGESYEGVLVRVENVEVTNPDLDYGEFEVDGCLNVDDLMYLHVATLGEMFASITGVHNYGFENYKIEPRSAADLVPEGVTTTTTVPGATTTTTTSTTTTTIPGEDDTIYQLQNPGHPEYIPEDSAVMVAGVIVTGVTASGHFFVEEPAGGAWSGVYVFDPAGLAPADLAVGDELSISGTVDEYFDLTEIKDLTSVERTGQGVDVPDPEVVDSCDIATGGSMGESYEGVLVRVENVEVTNPDLDYGEFEVEGCLNVDDLMYLHVATLGEVFASITGVHNYSFENYKLEPRSAADLVPLGVTTTTTVPGATTTTIPSSSTTTSTTTTTTTIPVVYDPGDVLIDELLYDPDGTDTGYEYIILYNATDEDIDLTGWEIQWGGTSFAYGNYVIPGAVLGAGEDLLIGGDQMSPTPDLVNNFNFQNGGEESDGVRIVAGGRAVIDTLIYDSPNTNGLAGDGGLDPYPDEMCAPDVSGGKVLARDDDHSDTDDCATDLIEDDPIAECEDADGDGYDDEACGGDDCDDADPDVNPGAAEGPQGDPTCSDFVDNDCDEDIDEADSGCTCWDIDGDGYLDEACGGDDCDDGDPDVNPGAVEGPPGDATCTDLADNDCDEYVDDADPDCIVSEDDTIYQLQNPSHPEYIPEDSAVTVEGVIVTGVTTYGHFFVEEPAGGAWSGVYVFDPAGLAPADLAVGDELSISGTVDEYYDLTEIKDLTSVERTGLGLDVPDPEVVDPCDIGTGGTMGEDYEGVLVRVEGVEVTNPDLGYGEFELDGCLRVDDLMYLYVATLGEMFASVTGIHNYGFDEYKLEPRSADDLVPVTVTTTTTVPATTTTTLAPSTTTTVAPTTTTVPFSTTTTTVAPTTTTTSTTTTSTTIPGVHDPGDVLIDELFYDPDGTDGGYEYIILYNATDGEIDLTGWEIQWGGTDFTYGNYPIPSVALGAGEDLLIGGDLMSPVPDIIYNFNFQNAGSSGSDGVRITDGGRTVIDTVIYGSPNTNGLPGDGGLDPYPDEMCAPDVPGGKVLIRDELHTDTDDCAADFTEDDPIGGCEDADGDGYDDEACGGDDCDDSDPDVNPGAAEGPQGDPTCSDLVDNDCDEDIDEADSGCTCWDVDGDGYLDEACGGDDCDDGDPDVNPGAVEGPPGDPTCSDLADNDCDEYIDAADPDCIVSEDDTIYQLQNPGHPDYILPDSEVTVEGVIVTGVTALGHFFVEEPAGGAWSGVYVYDPAAMAPADLAVGDELSLSGTVAEYFDLTEIKDLTSVELTGQGLDVPEPEVVDVCDIATGGTLGESYEGVLVRVVGVEVTNPDLGYGEFELGGCLRVDDLMYLYGAALGEVFAMVTGIHNYGFGEYKLEPRSADDLVPVTVTTTTTVPATTTTLAPTTTTLPATTTTTVIATTTTLPPTTTTTSTTTTTTTIPEVHEPGEVLIDELFYDPDGTDGGYEYIILYNATDGEIDLTGWEIQWGGTDFTYGNYPIPSVALGAGEDLLIGGDLMSPVPDIVYNFNFQNGPASDGVRITDGGRTVIDTVIYGSPNESGLPGDSGLDPYPDEMCALDVPTGKALARDALHTDTDDCAADFTETVPIGECWDADEDGYYDEACGGYDCDDTDPDVNPGVAEICDNLIDDDCDGLVDTEDQDCTTEFILDLEASYEAGSLNMTFTLGIPEPASHANYLLLTNPSLQVLHFWTYPLPIMNPPEVHSYSHPLESIGWVGIWSGLYTAEDELQADIFVWVDTDTTPSTTTTLAPTTTTSTTNTILLTTTTTTTTHTTFPPTTTTIISTTTTIAPTTTTTTSTTTTTTIPGGLEPGDVLIDELFYDPSGTDGGYEYILLYNATSAEIDLTGWEIQWGGTDYTYGTYTISGVALGAGEDLLIGGDLMSPGPDIIYNFNFQNGPSTDGVRITDGGRLVIDTVLYGSPNLSALAGDGGFDPYPDEMCAPDVLTGMVLARDALHTDTDDCAVDFTEADPMDDCDDVDGDGYDDEACGGDDCDDGDPDVNPGAVEGPAGDPTCSDLVDNDCNGDVDGDDVGCSCWDVDGDTYLDEACGGDDCDDGDPDVNPGAVEGPAGDPTCSDLADNDCDDAVDEADTGCIAAADNTIYQIQDPGHPEYLPELSEVLVEGVIVTAVTPQGHFFIEEPAGGAWSGVYVYDSAVVAPVDLAVGDEVSVEGTTKEYFGLTEIEPTAVTRTAVGQIVPGPDTVSACDIGTGGLLAENYEGVLVQVQNVEVTSENPDAPGDFGEFEVDACLRIDDLIMVEHDPALGTIFTSVTGLLHFAFSNTKLEPRGGSDFDPPVK